MQIIDSMPLVSVIVPVYNVEEYLPCCVNSLMIQSYTNLEIILVDDGSPDSSGDLCDKYAARDERIKVIHKPNGGLSDARNAGLQIATGEYVTFVDSDDWLVLDAIDKMVKLAQQNRADIVACEYLEWYDGEENRNYKKNPASVDKILVLNQREAVLAWLYKRYYGVSACAKLYHRDCMKNIQFPVGRLHEDVGTTYKMFLQAQTVVYIPDKLYYYRQRKGSIVNSEFNERRLDYLYFTREIMEMMYQKYPQYYQAAVARHFQGCIQLGCAMRKPGKEILQEIRTYARRVVCDKDSRVRYRMLAGVAVFFPKLSLAIAKMGIRVQGI